ncbi:MAG TPA: 3-phosphoshikimate 1-carboxyvinyltransferase [Armatimonadota bacterium]|nr:3-phosphoshikimate 1-carboxyvinyltransferase [Armatimonadota bacterium]
MTNHLIMVQSLRVAPGNAFSGNIRVPGDKSISHRALLFGALADGKTQISGFLASHDTRATADCLRAMGVVIEEDSSITVHGAGLHGLRAPGNVLWAGNSGTTTRLLMGILAGQPFATMIDGDESLRRRPMDRVAIPLCQMGAIITGEGPRCTPPVQIHGGNLHAIDYSTPVASAQVKSAILLAGLYADGITSVTEPLKSRDHTERMLTGFGVHVNETGLTVSIQGGQQLHGRQISVPGDISSAAFFLVAGAIIPNAKITIQNVGINPTRSGVLEVLQAMGAQLAITHEHLDGGEPIADLAVQYSALSATEISGAIIPRLIDELPILAVAAAFAKGTTVIKDASELRVKESDRIKTVSTFLRDMGVPVDETADGMIIHGGATLHSAIVNSDGDHRIAMSAAIAAIAAGVESQITGAETIATSFPTFVDLVQQLGAYAHLTTVG